MAKTIKFYNLIKIKYKTEMIANNGMTTTEERPYKKDNQKDQDPHVDLSDDASLSDASDIEASPQMTAAPEIC